MVFITSPAKTQDFTKKIISKLSSEPVYLAKANKIATNIKKLDKNAFKSFLKVSDKLADLNYERFESWSSAIEKPAIEVYKGEIYKQFEAHNFNEQDHVYLQKHLRIITGMYGILKPYDFIKPYRLEMKANIEKLNLSKPTLYKFWSTLVTNDLNLEMVKYKKESRFVINLASGEYSKVIDIKKLKGKFINIEFRQTKNSVTKNIGLYAKQGRGSFIDFLIKNKINDIEGVKKFNLGGYKLEQINDNSLFFVKTII
ncbi:MAG: YaaA family protein [Candidatus Dojkabacteria bacterium]|nr:YaaA family protein [Candidatus Dojkabacteria bacterium]MDQ7020913.1 YaaA family protein [Candidatus Dojkabacteria bacterium]